MGSTGTPKNLKKKPKKKNGAVKKKAPLTKLVHDEAKKNAKLTTKAGPNGDVGDHSTESHKLESPGPSNGVGGNKTSEMACIIEAGQTSVDANFMSKESSIERAKAAFAWMIAPISRETFYSEYFEKKAFVVRHGDPAYYRSLFSGKDFDRLLHECDVYFGKNIDVTTYIDGQRDTLNPEGRALPAQVWSMYNDGCSVRLLNPQTYVPSVHALCYTLAEEFSSFVGANVYLTPAGTQGFAPHWDDIDAFVLQLEGCKRWRVYAPRCPEEQLPLDSSKNLDRDEVGELILETTLTTGDVLYMPRGFIHEAQSLPDSHSLHITISTNQHNTWADLFKILLPGALEVATEEDVEFRRTLPRDYLHTMGIMNSDQQSAGREKFLALASKLFDKLVGNVPIDAAVDQMAKNFIHDSLPPVLPPAERKLTAGSKAVWGNGQAPIVELDSDAEVRLLSRTACRIVTEGDKVNMYYITDNTKVYREHEEPFCIEITPLEATVVEFLLSEYPEYCKVENLPYEGSIEDRVELATMLYQKGLLLAK